MPADAEDIVAVIVTTRNSGQTLEACLVSIRQQTYPGIELVVVDNHSSDATMEIAHRYADTVHTIGPERSAQRNHGATLTSGTNLLFIDADMVLDREVVAEGVTLLHATGLPAAVIPEETVGEGFWTACRALERGVLQRRRHDRSRTSVYARGVPRERRIRPRTERRRGLGSVS